MNKTIRVITDQTLYDTVQMALDAGIKFEFWPDAQSLFRAGGLEKENTIAIYDDMTATEAFEATLQGLNNAGINQSKEVIDRVKKMCEVVPVGDPDYKAICLQVIAEKSIKAITDQEIYDTVKMALDAGLKFEFWPDAASHIRAGGVKRENTIVIYDAMTAPQVIDLIRSRLIAINEKKSKMEKSIILTKEEMYRSSLLGACGATRNNILIYRDISTPKPPEANNFWCGESSRWSNDNSKWCHHIVHGSKSVYICPWNTGDYLWVQEDFAVFETETIDGIPFPNIGKPITITGIETKPNNTWIMARAYEEQQYPDVTFLDASLMPRWASMLTVLVVAVQPKLIKKPYRKWQWEIEIKTIYGKEDNDV